MSTCPLCNGVCEDSKATIFDLPAHRACINGYSLRRGVAYVIDRMILLGGGISIYAVLGPKDDNLAFVLWVVAFGVWFIRDSLSGRFLGKAIMGLRVAGNMEGQPPTLAQSVKRNLPLFIPFAPIVAAFQIGHGRRMGENGAGTWVFPNAQQHNFLDTLGSHRPTTTQTEDEAYELLNDATKLEAKGRVEEALSLYQRIVERYPQTAAGGDAQKSAQSLRAKLGVACPAPVEAATEPPWPVAVAKAATEAPQICAQTDSQPSNEPPRQILTSMAPRPKWRTLRLAIGLAAALAIIAGVLAVGSRHSQKRVGAASLPDFNSLEAVTDEFGGIPVASTSEEADGLLKALRARAEKGEVKAQVSLGNDYSCGGGRSEGLCEGGLLVS